jgi:AhpD family alkylhydroperoxidase
MGPNDYGEMMTGTRRLVVQSVDPPAYTAVLAMEEYVRSGILEKSLLSLIKIRASQLNGCAFCLDMHSREATEHGETSRRLNLLAAWPEALDLYTERERAALALTEAVTLIAQAGVPDGIWGDASANFNEVELVQLLMAISTINVWNRLAISTRQPIPDLE